MKKNYTNILGVKVSTTNYANTLSQIEKLIQLQHESYVCVAAVHLIMECQKNPDLIEGVNDADLVTPDGMPLVWVSKIYKANNIERVYGPTLMLKLCSLAEKKGYKIFLLGGALGQTKKIKGSLLKKFPSLQISGREDTPTRPIPKQKNNLMINKINSSRADLVFVGLGCPLQEMWMIENNHKLDKAVCVGVGAAFDFISGNIKQAPTWMQQLGMEWIFRFFQEPRRLVYRYTVINFHFIIKISQQLWRDFLLSKLSPS